jgi:outer membrane protein assembly factor BamD (BamD/ComL family)
MMQKFIEWFLEHIFTKLNNALSDDGKYGKKYPDKTKLERIGELFLDNMVVAIACLIVFITGYRLLLIYNNLIFEFRLMDSIDNIYLEYANLKVTFSIVLIIASNLLLVVKYVQKSPKPFFSSRLLVFLLIMTMSIISILPFTQKIITNQIIKKAIVEVELLRISGQYDKALEILNPLIKYSGGDSKEKWIINKQAATIESAKKNYINAIRIYLDALTNSTNFTLDTRDLEELQENIYLLGDLLGIEDAEFILEELDQDYPNLNAMAEFLNSKPTDPLWLGITPTNYIYLTNDDIYKVEYKSLNEYATLTKLVEKYPNDPLANYGRIILGDYTEIADNEPDNQLRDWAIYKSGCEAFEIGGFSNAAKYFKMFIDEFPRHDWADDAAYKLGRSYELLGDYDMALQYSLMSLSLPDGNMNDIIYGYSTALIDVYFGSDTLQMFIKKNQDTIQPSNMAILDYSLAELLMMEEQFSSAKTQFNNVKSKYAGNVVVEFVDRNLLLLDKLIELDKLPYPKNKIEIAKMLIRNPTGKGTENLIFYNDYYSYKSSRNDVLDNIGIGGPPWSYYEKSNDHLHAAIMLDDVISNNPNSPYLEEAFYLISIANYNLTFPSAFLPGSRVIKNNKFNTNYLSVNEARDKSENCQNFNNATLVPCSAGSIPDVLNNIGKLQLSKFDHSPYATETLSLVAIGIDNLNYKEDDSYSTKVQNAIFYLRSIYTNYPNSNLANNAAIYEARLYRRLADSNNRSVGPKRIYLENALNTYKFILEKYPDGHVGDEARSEYIETLDLLK